MSIDDRSHLKKRYVFLGLLATTVLALLLAATVYLALEIQ